jgi:predicted acyl esterase
MKSAGALSHLKLRVALIAVGLLVALLTAPAGVHAAKQPKLQPVLNARGSVNQVYVTNAEPGEKLRLKRRGGRVAKTTAGSLGGALFRSVKAGDGYRVRGSKRRASGPLRVMTDQDAPPTTEVYDQDLPRGGYGYLRTRDGTKLAMSVRLPGPADHGPYPTLVEYSGYGYARPSGAQSGISPIANLLGFAVVDVNMRGTGCSGGAFDYFERLQSLDGYDVVETVAQQPWALHGNVGMLGISYGGISQLFVGATNPPHLSGITPLSVIDDTATILYPGGILNTGFAFEWAKDRIDDALPASPTGGQPWAYQRIQEGDEICEANQVMHTEAVDLVRKIRENQDYVPSVADPLSPNKFVHKIKAPVFLACQFNDEQTGAHCPRLVRNFTGTSKKWFTFTNGLHVDSLDPATFNRLYDFLSIYVAERPPNLGGIAALAPAIYQEAMGISGVNLPPDPIQGQATLEAAQNAFESQPRVRILFDNGDGETGSPGKPFAGFEEGYSTFPPPSTQARSWYLGPGDSLTDDAPVNDGIDSFAWDKDARPPTNFTGNTGPGGLWGTLPDYNWVQPPDESVASYLTDRLANDTGIVGAGALEAWVRSSVPDVDLQVTISEVRPDGKETYVQSGWLRASRRKLDPDQSTLLEPVPTFKRSDRRPMPQGRFTQVTVPLYYQGHVYRAGSRIRVTITAPSNDQPVWSFDETVPSSSSSSEPPVIEIAHSPARPSRLILPLIPGLSAQTPLPPCPSLRGEPCRVFEAP